MYIKLEPLFLFLDWRKIVILLFSFCMLVCNILFIDTKTIIYQIISLTYTVQYCNNNDISK